MSAQHHDSSVGSANSPETPCNQRLPKPVSKQNLLSIIQEYGPMGAPFQASDAGSARAIAIEIPAGLEEIAPGYLAARRREIPEMISLLAAFSFDRLAVLGHNIKGSGGAYGFPPLTRIGASLEDSAGRMDSEALGIQLTELKDYLDRVQLVAKS